MLTEVLVIVWNTLHLPTVWTKNLRRETKRTGRESSNDEPHLVCKSRLLCSLACMFVLFHNNWYIFLGAWLLSALGIQSSQNFLEAAIAFIHYLELGGFFLGRTNLLALVGNQSRPYCLSGM